MLGRGALLLPLVLALGAWRVLSHPPEHGTGGRLVVGWTALSLGALGVVHAVTADGPQDERGGAVGFALGDPLADGADRPGWPCPCCCCSRCSACSW